MVSWMPSQCGQHILGRGEFIKLQRFFVAIIVPKLYPPTHTYTYIFPPWCNWTPSLGLLLVYEASLHFLASLKLLHPVPSLLANLFFWHQYLGTLMKSRVIGSSPWEPAVIFKLRADSMSFQHLRCSILEWRLQDEAFIYIRQEPFPCLNQNPLCSWTNLVPLGRWKPAFHFPPDISWQMETSFLLLPLMFQHLCPNKGVFVTLT